MQNSKKNFITGANDNRGGAIAGSLIKRKHSNLQERVLMGLTDRR
jgi:hypothetical protein